MCKCELCGRGFKGLGSLQVHIRCHHGMGIREIEEYYIKYFKKEGEGIDPITGGNTDFISIKRGYKRFEKDNPKKLATNTVEHYLLKGLSLDEAKERVAHTNKSASDCLKSDWKQRKELGRTRGGWSKKHFMELGFSEKDAEIEVKRRAENREKKMKEHRDRNRESGEYKKYTPTCIEYYLNKGMSVDDAKEALKKRQATNKVETYIKKYGEIDGVEKFIERNKKWSEDIERRYHDGEFSRDSNKNGNGVCNKTSSNSEIELSSILFERLNEIMGDFKYMSASTGNKRQYFIFDSGRCYFYDIAFQHGDKKRIIEFNGDFWHMNPKKYKKDDINKHLGITAEKIWEAFDEKLDVAKNKGFETFVVWENEWNENKDFVVKKCLNFLLDE